MSVARVVTWPPARPVASAPGSYERRSDSWCADCHSTYACI